MLKLNWVVLVINWMNWIGIGLFSLRCLWSVLCFLIDVLMFIIWLIGLLIKWNMVKVSSVIISMIIIVCNKWCVVKFIILVF